MFTKENSYNHAHVLDLRIMSARIRKLTLESITNASSGHPGGSLSVTDILTALYFGRVNGKRVVNYDPKVPNHPCRDRVILSKGHAAPALYSTLAYAGFMEKDEVRHGLRQLDSRLQGHPSMKHTPGIDFSTGSLGQGLSAAVGMALAGKERRMDYKVFAILGDGEMQEGQVWEALLSIPNKRLNNLWVIIDANGIQIDGTTKEINDLAVLEDKLKAFNFDVKRIDGHMFELILDALNDVQEDGLPSDVVYAIVEDAQGALWLSTNQGLSRFDPQTKTAFNRIHASAVIANGDVTNNDLVLDSNRVKVKGAGVINIVRNDMDYKALTNVGTWFLGRLRKRDCARDLKSELAARNVDPDTLTNIKQRQFLLQAINSFCSLTELVWL